VCRKCVRTFLFPQVDYLSYISTETHSGRSPLQSGLGSALSFFCLLEPFPSMLGHVPNWTELAFGLLDMLLPPSKFKVLVMVFSNDCKA
jgi:hypothetical protein